MSRLPDFIIIGAMKAATTTLHELLAAQPGVFMSTPKEPCFFSNDDIWARGTGWYTSLFDAAPAGAMLGESSTHYTKLPTYPETVERARSVVADAKLIYIMRHPVDRLVSHYIHEWSQGNTTGTIEQEIGRNGIYIAYSRYGMQIQPWLEAFGAERVLPVFFDRLRADPAGELRRVAAFLGLPGPVRTPKGDRRENVSSDRLRKGPLLRFIMETPGVSHARRLLVPRRARDWVKDRFFRMKRRPELSDHTRRELEKIFDDDLGVLSRMLGLDRPLSCANFHETAASMDDPRFVSRAGAGSGGA